MNNTANQIDQYLQNTVKKNWINITFKLAYIYKNMLNHQPHTELIIFQKIEILSYLILGNNRVKSQANKIKITKISKCLEINCILLGIP